MPYNITKICCGTFISSLFFLLFLSLAVISPNLFANEVNSLDASYNADSAQETPWIGKYIKITNKDMKVYEIPPFRIFYFTEGEHKISNTDRNKNAVPDYVEDVGVQFWASRRVFKDILNFPCPLETPYYQGVKHIDVYILTRNHLKGYLGMAFSAPVQSPLNSKEKSLKIMVAKGLNFKSSTTIPHEYFHLIQNGMSQIRNMWYFEGLARWSEGVLSNKDYYVDPKWNYEKIKKSPNVLQHVQTLGYKSGEFFWVPLSKTFGKNDNIPIKDDDIILKAKYSDGSPVVQDKNFWGANLIKNFLYALHAQDSILFDQYNLTHWDAETSKHIRNNRLIMQAIDHAIAKQKQSIPHAK